MRLDRVVATISLWMARIGGCLLLAVALLVSLEVTLRATRLATWSVGTELATYALALGATWSLAYVVFERAHVRVDILAQRLPPLPRSLLDLAAMASLFGIGLVLCFGGVEMVGTSLRLASRSNTTLGVPLVWPHAAWTFGLIWFTAVAAMRTLQTLLAIFRKDFKEAGRLASSPSADDEVEEAIAESQRYLGREVT